VFLCEQDAIHANLEFMNDLVKNVSADPKVQFLKSMLIKVWSAPRRARWLSDDEHLALLDDRVDGNIAAVGDKVLAVFGACCNLDFTASTSRAPAKNSEVYAEEVHQDEFRSTLQEKKVEHLVLPDRKAVISADADLLMVEVSSRPFWRADSFKTSRWGGAGDVAPDNTERAQYDTLFYLKPIGESPVLFPDNRDEWLGISRGKNGDNPQQMKDKTERFRFNNGVRGRVVYLETSKGNKAADNFRDKFEFLGLRPLQLLSLVAGISVKCESFSPNTAQVCLDDFQGCREKPVCMSMIVLISTGRLYFEKSVDFKQLTASYATMTTRIDQVVLEKDQVVLEKDQLALEKDQLALEKDQLAMQLRDIEAEYKSGPLLFRSCFVLSCLIVLAYSLLFFSPPLSH
jgi:hypothetical protein